MSGVNIKPVIYSQYKRRDGGYSVKMRVTLHRVSRYLTTSEIASPSQLTKKLEVKDPALRSRLMELELKMRKAVEDLDVFALEDMTADDVLVHIKRRINGDFRLDFLAYWEDAVKSKPEGSRINYMSALHSLEAFLGTEHCDISKITSNLMRKYEAWLVEKYGKGARAVTMYTAAVKHVHTLARREFNTDEYGEIIIRNPFEFYSPPKQNAPRHRNVSPAIIQEMIDNRRSLCGRERRAVDAYLLSFGLMGMNAVDLLGCAPPENGVVIYNRSKTKDRRGDKAEMHVRIEDCVRPIFDEWADNDGQHAFTFHRYNCKHTQFNSALAHGLSSYCRRMDIADKVDFYSARHTWASVAYSIGIDKAIINDCLCHVDQSMKVTDIYINKDWAVLWGANRRVLDLFNWAGLQ